ncbi:hypothetical protein BIV60_01445 [Bacillus sp. MUM 116]|uniref:PilN domain-containing protein n=1 Tax=Bacillus sp. MUM 116 TaxID=1678002 RepID=UPI0008F57006|nr:PilN domain-containing protein [Bacillus sp. MUM 116]OIK16969.1 hypothetical protein BIV60_01445 [Bacillus sp. MUM 116]
MLVEINLLPPKEPKKINMIIAVGSALALFLLIGGFYFWQINSTKSKVTEVDRQISMTRKIAEKEQQKTDTVVSSSSVSQLKSAIEWANSYSIPTIPVMKHLTSLLPERGFIQSFGYTDVGTVTLTVQFDSAREAAYFLDSLNESKWIEEASLNSLSTTETNTANSTAVSNNQTNTNSTGSSTNSQSNGSSTSSGTNTQSTTSTNTSTNNSTSTTVNDNNQIVNSSSTGSSTQTTSNSNIQTNQNSTTSNSSTSSSSALSDKKDNKYLPRYTGQFEIKLNKDNIKEILKKSKKGKEGVTGS